MESKNLLETELNTSNYNISMAQSVFNSNLQSNKNVVSYQVQAITPDFFIQCQAARPQVFRTVSSMHAPFFNAPATKIQTQLFDNMIPSTLRATQPAVLVKKPSSIDSFNSTVISNSTLNNNFVDVSKHSETFGYDSVDSSEFNNLSDYDMPDVPTIPCSELSPEQQLEFTRLALKGCEAAEKLAHAHRSRPCFKKIDTLIARLKQDLLRPDGVLANINSQGIAWAVKDFIFVFTRIINAWTIIKGYVYNTPEGLYKVKSSLSSDFTESFMKWQDTTMIFVDNLIQSYINLDQLVQNQRTAFNKNDTKTNINNNKDEIKLNHTNDVFESIGTFQADNNVMIINKNFNNVVENSEETQRRLSENGSYFKTGAYNALQKERPKDLSLKNIEILRSKPLITSTPNKFITSHHNAEILNWIGITSKQQNSVSIKSLATHGTGDGNTRQINKVVSENHDEHKEISVAFPNPLWRFNWKNQGCDKIIVIKEYDEMIYLIDKICAIDEFQYFFSGHFTKNYLPDFLQVFPNFVDLRTIIFRTETGGYKNIYAMVHDLRQIVFTVKMYLQKFPLNSYAKSIFNIERKIDKILLEDCFLSWNFSNLTGNSNDIIPENNEEN